MTDVLNRALLRISQSVFVQGERKEQKLDNHNEILLIETELLSLGYRLVPESYEKMSRIDNIVEVFKPILHTLQDIVGDNRIHEPYFAGFPTKIPDLNEFNQKRLYSFFENFFVDVFGLHDFVYPDVQTLSCGHFVNPFMFDMTQIGACPVCGHRLSEEEKQNYGYELAGSKELSEEYFKLKPLKIIDESDFNDAVNNLCSVLLSFKVPYSDSDLRDINYCFSELSDKELRKVSKNTDFKLREARAIFIAEVIKREMNPGSFRKVIGTATDILRSVACLNDYGQVTLQKPPVFGKFKRSQRRVILNMLEKTTNIKEDMLRYPQYWLRLGERIHPGEYRNKYPKAFNAFNAIRKGEKIKTFNSKVEEYLETNPINAVKLLKKRPGDFTRRFDHLCRKAKVSDVINAFTDIIDDVTTPMLIQLRSHINNSLVRGNTRMFLPKGGEARIWTQEETREPLSKDVLDVIPVIDEALMKRFSEKENFEIGTMDEFITELAVALSNRNTSESLRSMARGSKVYFDKDKSTRRLFLHWMQKGPVIDLDLSIGFYDENWSQIDHVSYTNLSNEYSKHSGDFQSAPSPDGATEFIDVNVKEARESGVRYCVYEVHSFTSQLLESNELCFGGIMQMDDMDVKKKFDPRAIVTKSDFTQSSVYITPMYLDLNPDGDNSRDCMVWLDSVGRMSSRLKLQNHESESFGTVMKVKAEAEKYSGVPRFGDLALMHLVSRCNQVFINGHLITIDKSNLMESYNECLAAQVGETGEDILPESDSVLDFSEGGNYSPFDYGKILTDVVE